MGHLVIEKLLKGLYAKNNPDDPIAPKIHNLFYFHSKSKFRSTKRNKRKDTNYKYI